MLPYIALLHNMCSSPFRSFSDSYARNRRNLATVHFQLFLFRLHGLKPLGFSFWMHGLMMSRQFSIPRIMFVEFFEVLVVADGLEFL